MRLTFFLACALAGAGLFAAQMRAAAPSNDLFANATPIVGVFGYTNGTTAGATKEMGEPDHAGNAGGRSVWYRWSTSSTNPVTFETIGSDFDTLLAIYTSSALGNLSLVGSNNDILGSSNRQSRVNFVPAPGTNYWIAVDGFNSAFGNLILYWRQRAGLPNLSIWGPSLAPAISVETFSSTHCAVVEGLVQAGTRKLVRFATESRNSGTADMILGDPAGNPLFQFSACHNHYHFQNYVAHRIKSGSTLLAVGGKVGHCLLDSVRWNPAANAAAIYDCSNQGIQVGWGDIYRAALDGQWIDITGVPPGSYTLELEVNPDQILEESSYTNNVTQVPLIIPDDTKPLLVYFAPTNGLNASPAIEVTAVIQDRVTQLDTNSIQLYYDGTLVNATLVRVGATNIVSYSRPGLLERQSVHSVKFVFGDNGMPVTFQTNAVTFTVSSWTNIYLPAPLYLETFDGLAEGALPAGWLGTNATTAQTVGQNLDDPLSDSYRNFIVISSNRLFSVFGTLRLGLPAILVNGAPVATLVSGNLAYADSDLRANSPSAQVNVLLTPDYNLTGRSNVFVSFHSLYEQNQDSLAALEYSIDQAASWLPVVYMVDRADIIRDGSGNIDAIATLGTARSDQASGLAYRAFIAAPLTSALAPFINGRIDDDPIESKRVERYRLPQADGRAKVRFRFVQTGTSSWYWGIDDFGIYSIPDTLPAFTGIMRNGNEVILSWNGRIVSRLQKKNRISDPVWQDVPGSLGLSTFHEVISSGEMYYRLKQE